MLLFDKFSNVLGDRKEEVSITPLLEEKSSTKDVDKGTDELADMPLLKRKYLKKDVDIGTDEFTYMKKAVVTIRSKCLYYFVGRSKVSTGWFKLDIGFLKLKFSTIHSEFYKELFENNIEDQDTELYTTFIILFDK